jgi:pimeloyl-[acyl-carrier protein] methyl ester esterase
MDLSRPQLVLLPGLDGTGSLFGGFVAEISSEFTTTVVQYPTTPASYNELQVFVSENLPQQPYMLIAESFSSPLAIQIAAAHPENLCALVLCAGFVRSPLRGIRRAIALALAPLAFRIKLPSFAIRYALVGTHASDELVQSVRIAVDSVPSATLAQRLRIVLHCDQRRAFTEIDIPVLHIAAKRDRLVDSSCTKEILSLRPDTRLAEIDGPHLILQSEPGRSAQIIGDFIRSIG